MDFGSSLDKKIPSAIVAVGSSVCSEDYWREIARLNEKYPNLKAGTLHRDIDLIIAPEKDIFEIEEIAKPVEECLKEMEYKHREKIEGKTYGEVLFYGQHDFSITLQNRYGNGMPVDLMLGRFVPFSPAGEKIRQERHGTKPFSVLRRGLKK